jgi:uncharacterized protein YrrD
VEDLGAQIAYLVLPTGIPVYDRDGQRVGVVEHVLADEAVDVFHGLIVKTVPNSRRHLFADRDQVGALHERGVVLSVRGVELHDPSEDPVASEAAEDSADSPQREGQRHAWQWLHQPH